MENTFENSGHSFTEGGYFEPEQNIEAFLTSAEIAQVENNGWIKIKTEKDLPEIKGSVLCWVFLHGKVQVAKYQCNHFEVRAEFGLYPWNLIHAYQVIEQPEPPLI